MDIIELIVELIGEIFSTLLDEFFSSNKVKLLPKIVIVSALCAIMLAISILVTVLCVKSNNNGGAAICMIITALIVILFAATVTGICRVHYKNKK